VADDLAVQLGNPRLDLAWTSEETFGSAIGWPPERVLRLRLLAGENVDQRRYIVVAPQSGQHIGHGPSVWGAPAPHVRQVRARSLADLLHAGTVIPVGLAYSCSDRGSQATPHVMQRPSHLPSPNDALMLSTLGASTA
jgi:hypothetical protein